MIALSECQIVILLRRQRDEILTPEHGSFPSHRIRDERLYNIVSHHQLTIS